MAVIQQITLRRDFKGVPKGTVVRIDTSGEADHSMSQVYRALRKEGYADDDFKGIASSAYWDWETVPGDTAALHNELERYNMPVASKKPAEVKKSAPKSKSKSKKSKSGSKSSVGHLLLRAFDLDSEAEQRKKERIEKALQEESEKREKQDEQCELHRKEEEMYAGVGNVTFDSADKESIEQAMNAYDEYLKVAAEARNNTGELYYGAKNELKLEKAREKEIKDNISAIKEKRDAAKNALKELKNRAKEESGSRGFGLSGGLGSAIPGMGGPAAGAFGAAMKKAKGAMTPPPDMVKEAKKGGCGPKAAGFILIIVILSVLI